MVTGNNEKGGLLGMQYLIDRGFKNIGILIGPRSTANSSRRLSGAIKAAMNNDIYINSSNIIHGDYTFEGGYESGKFFLEKNVDAIFSFSDMSSYGLLKFFSENNVKVPKDISLISYDNLFLNHLVSPNLTSIDQNLEKIAKYSIKMADDLIKNKKVSRKVMVEPFINFGESVGMKNEDT
ncbi:substrate-binding domain-containing protein [Anaerococcus senegalensis]|uniref:substrate-binding domain-containing protein n=1 Tax=Anaerococcus senegalensis TaxID=1288120 RepID=UPI0002D61EF2|nr:substrate-binding domain-containing protein [Anaerococcus senegalensis]